jgi:quercetin dioxygenase-like cupin family protein
VVRIENLKGGKGHVLLEKLIGEDVLAGKCGMFANVVLEQNCSLGYHEHQGESETYYILSGKGIYNDNGKEIPVNAGDVLVCTSGNGHGMKNSQKENLRFIALIIKG